MKTLNKILIAIALLTVSQLQAQVGIGTSSPNTSAKLDVASNSKGFLMPKLTIAQKSSMTPATGMQVFCTDCGPAGELQVYNGTAWTNMIGGTAAGAFTCGTSTVTFTYNGESVTYGTVSITYSTGTKCWLDRNLGASRVANAANDPYGYGDLFQWGRANDLHQLRSQTSMVGISGTTSTQSTTDNPSHGNFIIGNSDWRSTQNNNLWQVVNGINNPCPTGFRVPTNDDFTAEKSTWGSNKTNSAFSSTLKLPLTGYRSTGGSVYNCFVSNQTADYWTSTVTLSNSTYYVNKFEFFGLVEYFYQNTDRAIGCAIRCIKD